MRDTKYEESASFVAERLHEGLGVLEAVNFVFDCCILADYGQGIVYVLSLRKNSIFMVVIRRGKKRGGWGIH